MSKISLAVFALLAAPAVSANAAWTLGQWNLNPDNGHYYAVEQITGNTTGWLISNAQAQTLVGPNGLPATLATITSLAEDQFIFNGIDSPAFWSVDAAGNNEGPNLGGFQTDKNAEPSGDWAWVTGETWSYTLWNPGEPNNNGGAEDYLTFFSSGSGRSGNWNDISSGTSTAGTQGAIDFYIAEAGAPEPASIGLLAVGALGLLRRRK